jgi:pimeloyl-ACP methyl ester carboxylesterase
VQTAAIVSITSIVSRILSSGALLALALVATTFDAGLARAQMWLETADHDAPPRGPLEAVGAVIWSHGISVDSEDSSVPTPPYMTTLSQGGWDTFRFNRRRESDTLAGSSRRLVEEVHRLKHDGYRRVALAGHSFGAFISLIAAGISDDVDAVIATAPAAYGSFSDFYGTWRNNATKLYPLLEQVRRARVMVFYFHADDFDPGGRGEASRLILAQRKLPYVVVDQPPQLTSHWAAATPRFAKLYGNCILGFLDAIRVEEGAQCRGDTFWVGDPPASQVGPGTAATASGLSFQASATPGGKAAH